MKRHFQHFFWIITLLLTGLFPGTQPAQAEGTPGGKLTNLLIDSFPNLTVSLDVFDETGNFIHGLSEADLTLLEDGQVRSLDGFEVIDPGVEFVVAINPDRSFAVRDGQGINRLDKIKTALANWVGDLPDSSLDSYSLVTSSGPSAFHLKDKQSWLSSLEAYQPNSKNLEPSLNILSRAIDLASGNMLLPDARRAILFITPLADDGLQSTLQSLGLRASQLDVHVFVWVVGRADPPATPGFQAMQELARQTGGELQVFSGKEGLPNPADYLLRFRNTYQLSYISGLTTSGKHSVTVRVSTPSGEIEIPPIEFEIDLQPPNPILVLPPSEIQRENLAQDGYEVKDLVPVEQALEVIIEFPDGHPRPLASTSLWVDGEVVARNSSEPFDRFNWDLRTYATSGKHDLQVEAVDILGLSKTSISVPITVNIQERPAVIVVFLNRYGRWLGLGAAGLASLGLTMMLISLRKRKRAARQIKQRASQDSTRLVEKKQSVLRRKVKQDQAFLEFISDGEVGMVGSIIQLPDKEISFGSDETRSTQVLRDPSITALHAIIRKEENTFTIRDQGSVAGTWVNYESLGEKILQLKHGDTIHFGQLAFRFKFIQAPKTPDPTIRLDRPES